MKKLFWVHMLLLALSVPAQAEMKVNVTWTGPIDGFYYRTIFEQAIPRSLHEKITYPHRIVTFDIQCFEFNNNTAMCTASASARKAFKGQSGTQWISSETLPGSGGSGWQVSSGGTMSQAVEKAATTATRRIAAGFAEYLKSLED